ncbi:MAG: response regulator [Desulfobacterota bacterium]|nr:response regulator [Thermodesulfobacteriota bacterium]
MKKRSILIVDDEPNVISSLTRTLADEGYEIFSATSAEQALKLLEQTKVQVLITDERMPGMSGSELLGIVRRRYPHIVRIMLTGKANLEDAMRAVNQGEIFRFFTKPWDPYELKLSLWNGFEKYDLEEEQRLLLAAIKRQRAEMAELEKEYPGITRVRRDRNAVVLVQDITPEDIEEIKAWCRKLQETEGSDTGDA